MSDKFDPYRKWLGILPFEQPPDHYRLLGIVRFEDDADTISNAADRQMAHVRTFQTGPHSALSQKLLNEIAAARICLLDVVKKGEYDRQLCVKENGPVQTTVATPTELTLRPLDPKPPATPIARAAPTATAWSQPPVGNVPQVPIAQAKPPKRVPHQAVSAPIGVGPVARRAPPKINVRKVQRESSEAHKTLLIAAGLAAITIALFVAYKTRGGATGNVGRDEVSPANQLAQDDADKAREISQSREGSRSDVMVTGTVMTAEDGSPTHTGVPSNAPPPQVVVGSPAGPVTIWEKLTRQLNDLDSWKIASGQWTEKDGRLYGEGDSRLSFQEDLPDAFLLSLEMTVLDGMRPRIFFGQNFHFGNEGYDRQLFVHDGIKSPVVGAPRPYSTGAALKIDCRMTDEEVEFLVEDNLVARCGWERSGPVKLTISSKGQVLFGPFTLRPAPSMPLVALPPEPASRSIDKLAPKAAGPAAPATAANDNGWRDLFDGKSLAGWTGDAGLVSVTNGVLVNHGKRGIVVAPGDHRNFEIEMDFRLAKGGNSGLGICYSGSGDPSQNGLEIQMLDDTANRQLQDTQRCGAVYGLAAAKLGHFKRWPEWNRLLVTSLNDVVRVKLNGALVTDATRSFMKQANPQHPGALRTSGKICLFPNQGRSEYRHIRIRPAR